MGKLKEIYDGWSGYIKNKFDMMPEKVRTGEISCNIDSPDDCEACGS